MLANELAQWAALIVLSVCVFGLLRQLGQFMIPRKEQMLSLGPEVGQPVPAGLIGDDALHSKLMDTVRASTDGLGYLAVMNSGCLGCRALAEQLEESGRPTDGPMIAVLEGGSPEFRERLERFFDMVLMDPGGSRAKASGIVASPFILAFDAEMHVRHRGISGAFRELIEDWNEGDMTRDDEAEPFVPRPREVVGHALDQGGVQ